MILKVFYHYFVHSADNATNVETDEASDFVKDLLSESTSIRAGVDQLLRLKEDGHVGVLFCYNWSLLCIFVY